MPSHIPIQKSCQNHSSANLGVESRSWIKAFPLQFGSISHFLCDAAAKFEVKALVPLSAPACPDRGLSTPVFRRLGARTIETSKPWLFGAIRKPTKSLPPLRARAIARDHLSHLFLEIKNNIDYYLGVVCQQIDLKMVIYS